MKTLFTLALAASLALAARAQDSIAITFAVDMTGVEEFDAATDVLRVAGNFQLPDEWSPMAAAGDNILSDPDTNGVWAVTYQIPAGADTIQYKYVINDWGTNEFPSNTSGGDCTLDDGNRFALLPDGDSAVTLQVYLYSSCELSQLPIAAADTTSEDTTSAVRALPRLAGVSVTPNPASERATVLLPALDGETFVVRVLGADGRLALAPQTTTATTLELDGADLPPGLYLVDVTATAEGRRAVVKLLVE